MICDAHCHFFSTRFFEILGRQGGEDAPDASRVAEQAGCDDPGTPEALADRWRDELNRHGVARSALMASVPGDEESVWRAVNRHPARFVGYFLVDPTQADALNRVAGALDQGLRVACLFPAMHQYSLSDERVLAVGDLLAGREHTALFAHCGAFSVGIRKKLGLRSAFESRFGNPLELQRMAQRQPALPVIVPHFGAGFFRETLMLADLCSNVVVDSSSSNGWIRYHPRLTLKDVFDQALTVLGPTRLLFGTDSSYFPRGWQHAIYTQQRQILADLSVAAADAAHVFGGNFDRLFPTSPRGTGGD